jgi:SAM-dependent methyltransferase
MPAPPLTPLAAAVLRLTAAPERVLQIESGDGGGVFFLAREFPSARVRGVDRDPDLVRAATARVGLDPEGRVAFKVGKPRSLPYPDGFFDLVVAVDATPAAAELARVLAPGGTLILARSRDPEADSGLARRLLRRRLARRGVELEPSTAAGDGSFSVGRRRGEDRPSRAD